MLKVFALLTKLPHLSAEQFSAHWRDPHGVLARRIPQIERYEQNHDIGPLQGLPTAPYTGIATIWLRDIDAMAAMSQHPDYAPLDADGDRMYQRDKLAWVISQPTIRRAIPEKLGITPVKAMLLLRAGDAGALAKSDAETICDDVARLLPAAIGISCAVPVDADATFSAIVEIAFASHEAFAAAWATGSIALLQAVARSADLNRSCGMLVHEERVI